MSPLAEETRAALMAVSTATVATQLLKRGFRNVFPRGPAPLDPANSRMVGPAFTLRFIPMREDLTSLETLADPEYPHRKAMEITPEGAVLVIDARGETGVGVLGDILATRLKVRGVAGVLSDGPVRDALEVAATGLAIHCAGRAAPASPTLHHAADYGLPIACGGVAIFPGDVIVADGDGAVVIPRHLADEVARDATEQERLEAFLKSRIEAGHPLPGTYPPNEATQEAYRAAREAGNA